MSKTDHKRPTRRKRAESTWGRRQPRPLPHRARTRTQAVRLALRQEATA